MPATPSLTLKPTHKDVTTLIGRVGKFGGADQLRNAVNNCKCCYMPNFDFTSSLSDRARLKPINHPSHE